MPFVRRAPNAATRPPAGTIPSPSAPSLALISTGIPSFDDILGGGQPVGSILSVLSPDEHSAWGRLVERYWIAQGLAAGQDVLVVGGSTDDTETGKTNTELEELVAGCMWLDEGVKSSSRQPAPDSQPTHVAPDEPDSDAEGLGEENSNRTKIAWRYENMKKFQTTVSGNNAGASSLFHHTFNLTNTIPSNLLSTFRSTNQLTLMAPVDFQADSSTSGSSRPYTVFKNMLDQLRDTLKERGALAVEQDAAGRQGDVALQAPKKAVRIVLHEFGSLNWSDHVSITVCLRAKRPPFRPAKPDRLSCVTSPEPAQIPSLSQDANPGFLGGKTPMYEPLMTPEEWLKSLGWASDACIEFQGFASDPSLNVSFPHSHGLVHVHALPTMHTLLPPAQKHSSLLGLGAGSTGQNNLAFKLKRKRLIIETLHLGVEGGVGERRTEPTRTGGPVDVRKMKRDGNDHGHVHEHGHSHAHHHHAPAEGVDKPAEGTSSVRFAAMDIAVEAEPSVRSTDSLDRAGPPQNRERKKVSFIRHDKPELYEF
ncbi:hypothetical protein QFC19_009041 [Naganishia cerealis]|uniref:Uncharacterized protein n=1 Tax=Naganishia cerealis TaxID=610337 RepID=A0ACC2UWY6_9TREE|nr:hypothetical protein QFC19_009041 [Naganishia cerealis]